MGDERPVLTKKVLVIGDPSVGKTSLICQYVSNTFSNNYKATLGVDFALKTLEMDNGSVLKLQLWDIAGQERYGNLLRVYYKMASACAVVFDITRRSTMESVQHWKRDLDEKVHDDQGNPIPAILLANKCDASNHDVTEQDIKKVAQSQHFVGYALTSARNNIGLDDAFRTLMSFALSSGPAPSGDGRTRVELREISSQSDSGCAC